MSIVKDKSRGTYVFYFSATIDGERVRAQRRLPKGWSKAQVDEYDRKESGRLYAERHGISKQGHLIEDAVAHYLNDRVPQLSDGKNVARELALLAPFYRGKRLTSLSDVCKSIETESMSLPINGKGPRKLEPATIRIRISYLRAACRYAWKRHNFGDVDPAANVTTPKVRNERQLYLGRADMLAVARATRHRGARMAVRIAFYSGMRLSEVMRAVPKNGEWILAKTKNGSPRHIPIHPRAAVCARHFKTPSRGTLQQHIRSAMNEVGLNDYHLHDFRHSTASEMINAGVDLFTVGKVLGHKDPRSTSRYAHLQTKKLEAAIRLVGQKSPTKN